MGRSGPSDKLEFPIRQLVIRRKGKVIKRKPHNRPIKDVDKQVLTNHLDRVERSLVNLSRFNRFRRLRERTEISSLLMEMETSTTRKDD